MAAEIIAWPGAARRRMASRAGCVPVPLERRTFAPDSGARNSRASSSLPGLPPYPPCVRSRSLSGVSFVKRASTPCLANWERSAGVSNALQLLGVEVQIPQGGASIWNRTRNGEQTPHGSLRDKGTAALVTAEVTRAGGPNSILTELTSTKSGGIKLAFQRMGKHRGSALL